MLNVKRKLWSGTILIQQDNLPGLCQGEEISVDIFHEEASKHNRENFDWALSSRNVSKFWRFPKGSLKSKTPEANLLPFIKDSCIVKLSLLDGEDHTKFASLVECLAKAGKEAFCGFLRVEEDDLRPLCLMVTERGLLGFCVDDPLQEDDIQESSTALFSKFEKMLKDNFAADKGKSKVMKGKSEVDTKDILNSENEEIQSNIEEKMGQVPDERLNAAGEKPSNEYTIPSVEVSSEVQVNSKVDYVQKTVISIPASSVKEEAKEIARNVFSRSASQKNQQVNSMNMEKGDEADLQTNTSNVMVDVTEDISDWASSEVVVKAENSKRFRNCGRFGVISKSWNPSFREKALAIARNVLVKKHVEDGEQIAIFKGGVMATNDLPLKIQPTPVYLKSPNPSSSYPELQLPDSTLQAGPSANFTQVGSFIVDGKDPRALKIYSTTNEKGTEVLHPVDHDYVSDSTKVPQNLKSKEPNPKNLYHFGTSHESPVSSVAKCLFNQNVVEDVRRTEIIRPAIDLGKAVRGKEYFTRKFASLGLSRMKEIKATFLKYLNKESNSEEFVKKSKLAESSQVTSATAFLESTFPHFREAILVGKVRISDLHWIFTDTSIDHNGVIADTEVSKKDKDNKKLSKLHEPSHLPTTLAIPLEYKGHGECTILIRGDNCKEYLAIFTKDHVLFCNKSIRLPPKLVQDYSLQNKVWNEATEGKVYLPDMIFPTKLNEVHFFIIQDCQRFKEKLLNLGNLQESSSLITKENFLKFSVALTDENQGIVISWIMINPSNEECLVVANDTSVFLTEVNAISSSPNETIDLFHDRIERLIDVPGIDDETALQIYKSRMQTKTLVNFIHNYGFKLLTEIIQLDIGLLARKDLTLCYNGLPINSYSWYLKTLEQNLFEGRFIEWRRPDNIPCLIMVAVLGFLTCKQAPRVHQLKSLIEMEGGVEKSWVKFAKIVISFMEVRLVRFKVVPVLPRVTKTTSKVVSSHDLQMSKKFSAPIKVKEAQKISFHPIKVKAKEVEKMSFHPSKLDGSKVVYDFNQIDAAGRKPTPHLLAVTIQSTTSNNNNIGPDEVGESVKFSSASPVKLPIHHKPVPKLLIPSKPTPRVIPSLVSTKKSNDASSSVSPSSISCSYSPAISSDTASKSTSTTKIGISLPIRSKVVTGIDEKLFLKSCVKVERISWTDLRQFIGNDNDEDIDDIVNLEEVFDNCHLYAEPVSVPVEILLPSLKSKLEELKISQDSKKTIYECSLCKKVFSDQENRHQHYLSLHAGLHVVVAVAEKQFECRLCEKPFIDWQGRHEHYMAVHCR